MNWVGTRYDALTLKMHEEDIYSHVPFAINKHMCVFIECNAGYYGNATTNCTLCPGNTIKSSQGDAADCNAETPCDGVSNEVNAEHTACGRSK